jgi:predicted glycoside hydrolase/deacetylase ChbG (UPF0249 family)
MRFVKDRWLLITADDFGIGPLTSQGILKLAERRVITSTVLLVTSPYAEDAIRAWRGTRSRLEVGWHPCLTLDRPILPPRRVPSLVTEAGGFYSLGAFLARLLLGKICCEEVQAEFAAQYQRFIKLVGSVPYNVNAHHHIHVFEPIRRALVAVLDRQNPKPYLRPVRENWGTLLGVRGARLKRMLLSAFGTRSAGKRDFPGADRLIGITDPIYVHRQDFFQNWLYATEDQTVELTCHPGRWDDALEGRDGSWRDGQLLRRVKEYEGLIQPEFLHAVEEEGFTLVSAADLLKMNPSQVPIREKKAA